MDSLTPPLMKEYVAFAAKVRAIFYLTFATYSVFLKGSSTNFMNDPPAWSSKRHNHPLAMQKYMVQYQVWL